mmetsp:Transcript_2779/g.7205  ORF Transcript_2779/g.7205 Transcript_2779/m.7205 type:complete len:246 (+) Transcript_2779:2367-3104(+)
MHVGPAPTCALALRDAAFMSGGVLAPWTKAVRGFSTPCLVTRASDSAALFAATWLRHTTRARSSVRGEPCTCRRETNTLSTCSVQTRAAWSGLDSMRVARVFTAASLTNKLDDWRLLSKAGMTPDFRTFLAYSGPDPVTADNTLLALACTGACSCAMLAMTPSRIPHETTTWESKGSTALSFAKHCNDRDWMPATGSCERGQHSTAMTSFFISASKIAESSSSMSRNPVSELTNSLRATWYALKA